jgi:1-acyl-sn-glycerol-3-phosphate acyltransferase
MAYIRGNKITAFGASFLPTVVMFHFTLQLARAVNWLVYRLRIKGREHLRQIQSGLLVSNHTLVVDPGIIAHVILPRRTYFTMLEETACIPLLGTFVRLLGAIPIPSSSSTMRILERAIRKNLGDLHFLHVFPEGECHLWNQQIQDFQPGVFFLACRLQLPVVPITTVLHQQRWLGRVSFHFARREVRVPPRVTVVVGEPIYPSGKQGGSVKREAVELSHKVRSIMQRTIDSEGGSKSLSRGPMPRIALHRMFPVHNHGSGKS